MALIGISFISCSGLNDFPDLNPKLIDLKGNRYFKCSLVDKENFLFKCDKKSSEITNEAFESNFCFDSLEIKSVINWSKDAKDYFKKNCNSGVGGN